ncbi:IS3 family transposase [Thomasclavelia spiroformis]
MSIEKYMFIINEYIRWYNTERLKKSLNYLNPKKCRQLLDLN